MKIVHIMSWELSDKRKGLDVLLIRPTFSL